MFDHNCDIDLDADTIDKIFTSEIMTMIIYHTDWSCNPNPWKWWRCFIRSDWYKNWGTMLATTNNFMELNAIHEAVNNCISEWLVKQGVKIISDSMRAVNMSNGVRKASKYRTQIKTLQTMVKYYKIQVERVKWHNWDEMNEQADLLAKYYSNL